MIQSHISSSEYPHLVGWVILTASGFLLEAVIVRIHGHYSENFSPNPSFSVLRFFFLSLSPTPVTKTLKALTLLR